MPDPARGPRLPREASVTRKRQRPRAGPRQSATVWRSGRAAYCGPARLAGSRFAAGFRYVSVAPATAVGAPLSNQLPLMSPVTPAEVSIWIGLLNQLLSVRSTLL